MLRYEKLAGKPHVFQQLTGLSLQAFEDFLPAFVAAEERAQVERDRLDLGCSSLAELIEEPVERGRVATLRPPDHHTAVVVDAPALPEGITARLSWSVADWPEGGPMVHVTQRMGSFAGASLLLGDGLPVRLADGRASGVCCSAVPMRAKLLLRRGATAPSYVDLKPASIDPARIRDGRRAADPRARRARPARHPPDVRLQGRQVGRADRGGRAAGRRLLGAARLGLGRLGRPVERGGLTCRAQ